jgi:hypothetical protein
MNSVICALEQEIKYISEFGDKRSRQFLAGYQQALGTVVAFLLSHSGFPQQSANSETAQAVNRLMSFAPPSSGQEHSLDGAFPNLTSTERDLLGIALQMFRDGEENAEYLSWWLSAYASYTDPAAETQPYYGQPAHFGIAATGSVC